MITSIFKRWLKRRDVKKRLIAFAKTKDGRKFIEEMNNNNLILADMDAMVLGAENQYFEKPLRIKLPDDYIIRN